jgi:probable F420-dependent oxidoreductase
MKFGFLVPQIGPHTGRASLRDVCQAAEALGFASLWTTDHIVVPATYESTYPFSDDGRAGFSGMHPYYEMFTTLSFVSAITERIELGTAVCVVPLRHPVYLSKLITSLDHLSEGRFIFGAGAGWLAEEFEALGASYASRGRDTDEYLDFLRCSWSPEQPVAFEGARLRLRPTFFAPGPFCDRHIPFWIGGHARRSLERVARFGDAWHPALYGATPEFIRHSVEWIGDRRVALGRTGELGVGLFVRLRIMAERTESGATPWTEPVLNANLEQFRQMVRTYDAAGVRHMVLAVEGSPHRRVQRMTEVRDAVAEFAEVCDVPSNSRPI